MSDLTPGATATRELLVDETKCTERGGYHIFSTPELVLLVELTAIEALAPFLPDTRSSVGSGIDINHVAPTLKGQRVWSTVTVTEVDRRRVVFDIEVRDGVERIATGRHERFIVDLDRFAARLAEKASAAGNLRNRAHAS